MSGTMAMSGDELRRRREELGLTQQQVADALGVGPRTYWGWEAGEHLPRNRAAMLERFFAERDQANRGLVAYTDVQLLGELLRRAIERDHHTAAAEDG